MLGLSHDPLTASNLTGFDAVTVPDPTEGKVASNVLTSDLGGLAAAIITGMLTANRASKDPKTLFIWIPPWLILTVGKVTLYRVDSNFRPLAGETGLGFTIAMVLTTRKQTRRADNLLITSLLGI